MIVPILRNVQKFLMAIASIVILIVGGSASWNVITASSKDHKQAETIPIAGVSEKIRRSNSNDVIIPPAIVSKIQLRTAAIKRADEPIQLAAFQGALANDNAAMSRIHSRFAGEVVEIGHLNNDVESHSQKSHSRPLQPGDKVKKGQLLAVVWSRDLGQIKSQLVDALTNLKTDEIQLRKAEELYRQNSGPERSVRDAAQKVQSDKNAVATAERALRTARLTDQEIAAVRDEANRLLELNPGKLGVDDWARVELRATQDGTILEMNVSNGLIVDTSTDLFKISDLSHLMIWAHVYEDDLVVLNRLPKPIQWTVTIPSRSGTSFSGSLEQVGPIIDPNQHTALVSGHVENPDGELKIGQFATVTVAVLPPVDTLVIPSAAVVEDGNSSIVFTKLPGDTASFTRKPVAILKRTHDWIYIKTDGVNLQPGDQVLTTNALMLNEAFESLPAPK